MSREQALAAVRERISRYERTGDPDIVLTTEAILDELALGRFKFVSWSRRPDLAVCRAAGWLMWYRGVALARIGDWRAASNVASALAYLGPVYRKDPAAVPVSAEPLLAERGFAPRPAPAMPGDVRKAVDDLRVALGTGDQARIDAGMLPVMRHLGQARRGDATLAPAWYALGLAWLQRNAHTGSGPDLDNAIMSLRRACAGERLRRRIEPYLGWALYLRFERTGQAAELDEAIALMRTGLLELPPDDPVADVRWEQFAEALHSRYQLTGELATINEAVRAQRLAARFSQDARLRPTTLARLALYLRMRFENTGDSASLEEALETARRSIREGGDGAGFTVLADCLVVRFQNGGRRSDIDEAIRIYRRTLSRLPTDERSSAPELTRLAASLIEFVRRQDGAEHLGDLDEAIALLRSVPAGAPSEQFEALHLLGAALHDRWERTGDDTLLDQVVEVSRGAVAAAAGTAREATALGGHATALFRRHRAAGDPADLRAAIAAVRRAATTGAAHVEFRVSAARQWAEWSRDAGDWAEATDALAHLVGLLPRLAPDYLRRSDQEDRLTNMWTQASDAAAAALNAGRTGTAVEVLEQGRVILASAAVGSGDQSDDLRRVAPDLAREYDAVRRAREDRVKLMDHLVPDTERRYRAAEQWEHVVGEIRKLPGFERFLHPPRLSELERIATGGPVAVINVSRYRCDAIVLRGTETRVIPLKELAFDQLTDRVRAFDDALRMASGRRGGLAGRLAAQEVVLQTLRWLWDSVAGPVLAALDITGPPPDSGVWPRLWWSPTGPLSLLPLHAAGHHADGGPAVLDRVVSSYTPTLGALDRARRMRRTAGRAPLLTVAMPRTPGHADLDAAHAEGLRVAGARPGAVTLTGPRATRANVLAALPECGWAHFACHAHNDPAAPSTSHLLLYDQPLTVADITRVRLPAAELAYLSACATARTSLAMAGEAIHLGSAFQLAGFPHVVATLWPVGDEAAAAITDRFYGYASTPGPADIATALHLAVRETRDAYPMIPTTWAAHVHTGP